MSSTTDPEPIEGSTSGNLRAGAKRMLKVISQRHPTPLTRNQIAMLSGFAPKGGTFGTYLGDLRRMNLIVEDGNLATISDEGFAYLGDDVPEQPQTTAALMELWRGSLRAGAYHMLELLVEQYPSGLTREQLGEQAGFTTSGGTFGTYLGDLRRAGLLWEQGGRVFATENLFIDELTTA